MQSRTIAWHVLTVCWRTLGLKHIKRSNIYSVVFVILHKTNIWSVRLMTLETL